MKLRMFIEIVKRYLLLLGKMFEKLQFSELNVRMYLVNIHIEEEELWAVKL